MKLDEEQLASHHELYNLLQNETRKEILEFIYQQPKNYSSLIEFTGLKPGSLYHHLKVLKRLVEKRDHGLYGITELGKQVVEELDLTTEPKPEVLSLDHANLNDNQQQESQVTTEDSSVISSQTPMDQIEINELPPSELINQVIWLGLPNYVIMGLTLVVVVFLGLQGIALAGIAIYTSPIPIIFDIFAFGLGLFSLYLMEQLVMESGIYNRLQFALVIRVMGMLPAVIVGLALFLLYLGGIVPSASVYPYIFGITVTLGYLVMVSGLQYLRGMSRNLALNVALIPAGIDLLLGAVVLLVV